MSASRAPSPDAAPRWRRALAAGAALTLVAGFAALAAGAGSLAAPLLVLTYLVLIPAALLV